MSREKLIEGLNEDLAAELGTVARYLHQASMCVGLQGEHLRDVFKAEVSDELGHAEYLMDVIASLGGEPTTEPQQFEKTDDMRRMLEINIEMEAADVENYKQHAELAAELGMIDVQLQLEDMAADEAGHRREMERILKGM